MSNIIAAIQKLPGMESGTPAGAEEIRTAEEELHLHFAEEYKEYLSVFGAVCSDIIAVSGLCEDEDYAVVELTKKLRSIQANIPLDFYAIEDVGVDGLVIWQDKTGTVYQSIPNYDPVRIFDSLSDFLNHQIED